MSAGRKSAPWGLLATQAIVTLMMVAFLAYLGRDEPPRRRAPAVIVQPGPAPLVTSDTCVWIAADTE
jgi:hypothetical protein